MARAARVSCANGMAGWGRSLERALLCCFQDTPIPYFAIDDITVNLWVQAGPTIMSVPLSIENRWPLFAGTSPTLGSQIGSENKDCFLLLRWSRDCYTRYLRHLPILYSAVSLHA